MSVGKCGSAWPSPRPFATGTYDTGRTSDLRGAPEKARRKPSHDENRNVASYNLSTILELKDGRDTARTHPFCAGDEWPACRLGARSEGEFLRSYLCAEPAGTASSLVSRDEGGHSAP